MPDIRPYLKEIAEKLEGDSSEITSDFDTVAYLKRIANAIEESGGGSGGGSDTPLPLHFNGDFVEDNATIPVSEITAILENLPPRIDFTYGDEDGNTHIVMTCMNARSSYDSESDTAVNEFVYAVGWIDGTTATFITEMFLRASSENGVIDELSVVQPDPDGENTVVYVMDSIDAENVNLVLVGGGDGGFLPPEGGDNA